MKETMVLIGLTAMLFYGCELTLEKFESTEPVSMIETNIESIEEFSNELGDYITNLYIEAAKEIYGDSYDDTKATCDMYGITYEGKFVDWEYLEDTAYDLMIEA